QKKHHIRTFLYEWYFFLIKRLILFIQMIKTLFKESFQYYHWPNFSNNAFLAERLTGMIVLSLFFNVILYAPLNHGVISNIWFKFTKYLRCVLKNARPDSFFSNSCNVILLSMTS